MPFGCAAADRLRTLRVAAAVLVGGWCSAAVIGLVSWTVLDRVAGFPLAYFALPLAAVLLVTYALGAQGKRRLGEALAAGWTGFLLGSLPVLVVLPGHPSEWLPSLLGLSLAAIPMAGLGATARSMQGSPWHRLAAPAPAPS